MVKAFNYGRLGNVLFQNSTAIAYALKHNLEFTVPSTTKDPKWNPIYLQHLVNPKWDTSLRKIQIDEKSHAFQELAFEESWRKHNIVLSGYWQTEKYFKEYREQILGAFGFPWNHMPMTVSVHVRRGDYLTLTHKHPPVPVEWIESAMAEFTNHRFIFFSDDLNWCKTTFGHRDDCSFSGGANEIDDLVGGSCCAHHICSASTFSWWQCWLNQNPNKRVIFPKLWFQPSQPQDTSDIVPPEWERR